MRLSLVSIFINPNASSPKNDIYLGIVRWRRICSGHRIFYGTWLDNHPFYLCQLKDSWAQVQARSFLWFYWCCAQNQKIELRLQLPVERELPPENSVKSWYQYKWGVYGEKAFTSDTQRALQTSPRSCSSESKLLMCRKVCAGFVRCRKSKFVRCWKSKFKFI